MSQESAPRSRLPVPDTLLVLLVLALIAWGARALVDPGVFAETEADGRLVAESFQSMPGALDATLFGSGDDAGLTNFLFEGLVSGDRYSAAVGLVAFLLIVGGAFGVILKTGAVERATTALLARSRGDGILRHLPIPIAFVGFSLMGAVFGMSEECIVFALIVVPAMVRAGYDSITAVLVVYVASQIGFATSWMNPFSVVVAQSIADVPVLSGLSFRVTMWAGLTVLGALYTLRYAVSVWLTPERSLAYASDAVFRSDEGKARRPLSVADGLVLATLALGIAWVAWGVVSRGYYLPEHAAQFLVIGLLCGLIACLSPASAMTPNSAARAFQDGAALLVPAALVVGIAKGIVWLLGGDQPDSPSVLNTLLASVGDSVAGLSGTVAALSMYAFQSLLNVFVVSGSGQAALTMPLMAPLSDIAGVSRQIAVLAFQLGDGLTNLVVPASASLMGVLAAARLDWVLWLRFIGPFFAVLMGIGALIVMMSAALGFGSA